MDPICNGSFLRVSHENAIEAYIGMGIPREDAEILTDPTCKNRFEVEVCGNGIKWQEFYPTLPKYNQTYNLRVGEAVTFTTPITMTITATKKDGRTVTFEFLAGGKKTTSTSTFSPEGLTVKGRNDAGVEHTEVFARQEPEMCGMFLLEDSKSIVDMLVSQGKDRATMEAELSWCGWRISEKGGMIHHQEIFRAGGITRTFRLGEEFDNTNDFYEGPEVAVVTSDFPGSFTMVSRPAKGPALTFNWMVSAKGMVGSCTDGINTATFSYKRIPDIVGKWRMVTKQGVEAQLEALGMTGAEKAKAAANFIPTSVEGKALCGGRWRWESTPKEIHTDIEFAMNEEYSYTWAGETFTEIATYKPDMSGMLLVSKSSGKVVKSDMTVTKNFLITVFEIEGLANSRATVIFTRA